MKFPVRILCASSLLVLTLGYVASPQTGSREQAVRQFVNYREWQRVIPEILSSDEVLGQSQLVS